MSRFRHAAGLALAATALASCSTGGTVAPDADVADSGASIAMDASDVGDAGGADAGGADAGGPSVARHMPVANGLAAPVATPIVVTFDRSIDPTSITVASFSAFGLWSGAVRGTFTFSDGGRTVTLTPGRAFSAGERVMVVLSNRIVDESGAALRSAGYSFQFWTATTATSGTFGALSTLSVRSDPMQSTLAYGGVASDLDGDGWLDVAIVNEVSSDLRVFMNRGDGTGAVNDFLRPPTALGFGASPSDAADFDGDGRVDLAVANTRDNTVSIVLGRGDGTFMPQQTVAVGEFPRGLTALDIDGDGDIDIATANAVASTLSLLANDGSGRFGAATSYEGGGTQEWALTAADLNEDGIVDLVVGSQTDQQMLVHLGRGDGTFAHHGTFPSGGDTWSAAWGDVNGDGHADIAAANGSTGGGSILLGDGLGGLAAPVSYAVTAATTASDLGDLDGDGDLDWVIASYGGASWAVFTNDGTGRFSLASTIPAPMNGSCALVFDVDDDGDVDLGLIDETADVVVLMQNR